jgi:hypothetical protein
MVRAFEQASGRKVAYDIVARRPGDIAACYADPAGQTCPFVGFERGEQAVLVRAVGGRRGCGPGGDGFHQRPAGTSTPTPR